VAHSYSFRFPGEVDSYRRARNELLLAEIDHRQKITAAIKLRSKRIPWSPSSL
jgi:hypothetical protein